MSSTSMILDYDRRPLEVDRLNTKDLSTTVGKSLSSIKKTPSEIVKIDPPKSLSDQVIDASIPEFSTIKISTETIIAVSNLVFDLNNLYNYLPVVEYIVVKRKRGRKKKTEIVDPNKDIPVGSIISVQNKTNVQIALGLHLVGVLDDDGNAHG